MNCSPKMSACRALLLHDLRKHAPGLTEPELAALYQADYAAVRGVVAGTPGLLRSESRRHSVVPSAGNHTGTSQLKHHSFSLPEELAFSGEHLARERKALEKGLRNAIAGADNTHLAAALRTLLSLPSVADFLKEHSK